MTNDSDKIVICHIIFRLDFGGLENGLVNLINNLPHEKFRHIILSLKPPTKFKDRINQSDVEIYNIDKKEGKDPGAYFRVWRLLYKLKPDIVHTRNIPTLDMLVPAVLSGCFRLIHSEHGLDAKELEGKHSKYNLLRQLSNILVSHYIAVSQDLVKWLNISIRIPISKISLIYNGVDTDKFNPDVAYKNVLPDGFVSEDAFVIGAVGRLEPVKDQLNLAKAFVYILEQWPELRETVRLIIIGDGSLRSEIESILAEAKASQLVWMPGFQGDMVDYYRVMDLFVLPSRREGISNTLLEAMACGLPIVATDVGGNPEVVEKGRTGMLVPANEPDKLAEAISNYIQNHNIKVENAKAARSRAESMYSLNTMVQDYQKIYEALYSNKHYKNNM